MSNYWTKQFGAKRRESDRKLLREFESNLPDDGYGIAQHKLDQADRNDPAEMAIAKAGVRAALDERARIARAFGRKVL